MFISSFFSWWYLAGWEQVIKSFSTRLVMIGELFSVNQLLRTLFAPWRRIITYPGASVAERFRAWGDNVFSRTVGFFVRLFVLVAALIAVIAVTFATLIEAVLWPLLPPSIIGLIIVGIVW